MQNTNGKATLSAMVIFSLVLFGAAAAWSHGEGTRIVPASLTVKSGAELEVTVNGLVGTQTATFRLTGMTGTYELGKFPISSDDFTQVLKIPAGAPPGSYRLTVEGGDKSAKVVITIN
ncbi:MAG: hypothetical protein PVI71_08015 [Desulfobacterales bacterium]|jgi:hypothetical protein